MQKPDCSYKVKNGFRIHHFVLLAKVDYLFSTTRTEDFYRLLNVDEFGHLQEDDIDKLIKTGQRVAVVNNDTLDMDIYNIPEEEVIAALFEMG